MAPSSFGGGRILGLSFWLLLLISLSVCAAPSLSVQQRQSSSSSSSASSGLTWSTARSLASSLLHRIANHRRAKGDYSGAERIKHIVSTLDNSLSFWKNSGSIGWDYLVHYSWRRLNPSQVFEVLRLIGDIQSSVAEFLQLTSDVDRLRWMSTNYSRILQLAKSSLQKLLNLVDQPGALRNFVLSLQTEIVTGDIIRDAMQLGASDLQSLVQVAKDMLQRYYGPSSQRSTEL